MMRAVVAVVLSVLLSAAVPALAQDAAKPPARGKDITKDEYVERAKRRAAANFDKADTNRDGVLSADERRAARAKRRTSQQGGTDAR